MAKVTSVEPQKKNSKRFNVFLDGQFAFGADEDLVVERRLVVGKIIETSDLEKILFEAEVGKLMDRMYGLFGRRQRSEKEVRDYLRNLSFKRKIKEKDELTDFVIDALINKLKQKGLVNDEQFAKAWIESRRKSKKKGINALKTELYQKGINREIIDRVMNDEVRETGQSEEEVAKQALERKLKSWKNLPEMEFKKKAYDFLMRRGFSFDIVKEAVDLLLKE